MLKLSAPDWCFFREDMDPAGYYGRLREMGITGVEMVAPGRWEDARAAGLEIVNLSSESIERGLHRLEHHEDLLPKIRDVIDQAAVFDNTQVIIFSGNRAGQSDAEGLANCIKGIEELLPEAERQGVTLVFEMLNTFDHPDYQADHGAYGFQLARSIDSLYLKLIYDIYHMARMGDDCLTDILANLDWIAHLHVAGADKRGLPRADGSIRYGEIVPRVIEAGYDNYWGLEFEPEGDPLAELAEAVTLMKRLAGE